MSFRERITSVSKGPCVTRTACNNISRVRARCDAVTAASLFSLQRNRTITPINFMNGPLARQSLTPLVCAVGARVKGARGEKERRKKKGEKDEREVYRTRCHPSFCAVVVHGSARSLQPPPRHNALSSPTRTVSRYAIVEGPCPSPPPSRHTSHCGEESLVGEMCRATCTSRSRPRRTRARAYKRAAFSPVCSRSPCVSTR